MSASFNAAAFTLHRNLVPLLPPPLIRFLRSCESRLNVADGSILLVLLTVLLSSILIYLMFNRKKTSKEEQYHQSAAEDMGLDIRGNNEEIDRHQVWIIGPMGSGKTALFHRLRADASVPTVSSMMANDTTISPERRDDDGGGSEDKRSVKIVDYPGHPRLRTSLLPGLRLSSVLRAVMCVDASKLSRSSLSDAASILYDILTDPAVHGERQDGGRMEVLIACTHADVGGSRSPMRIKLALSSELDRMVSLAEEGRVCLPPLTAAAGAVGVVDWMKNLTLRVKFIGVALGGGREDGLKEVRDFVWNGFTVKNEGANHKKLGNAK